MSAVSETAGAALLGWARVVARGGRIVGYDRGSARIRPNAWGAEGAKAWIATAPGISACGPTPEAAIYKLRERAARALDLTK